MRNSVVMLVAGVALISAVLHARTDRRIGVHLVFATHLVSFFLLVPDLLLMCFITPLVRRSLDSDLAGSVGYLLFAPFLILNAWWYAANQRVFSSRRVVALAQCLFGGVLFWLVAMLSHQYLVFKLTLRALAE